MDSGTTAAIFPVVMFGKGMGAGLRALTDCLRLRRMAAVYFLLASVSFSTVASAGDFTAQAFCENPYRFVCETSHPIPDNSAHRRNLAILQQLRDQMPSLDYYIKNHMTEPLSESDLASLGRNFENELYRREAAAILQLYGPILEATDHAEILRKGFGEEATAELQGLGETVAEALPRVGK